MSAVTTLAAILVLVVIAGNLLRWALGLVEFVAGLMTPPVLLILIGAVWALLMGYGLNQAASGIRAIQAFFDAAAATLTLGLGSF